MTDATVELVVNLSLCSFICLIVLALARVEMRQRRQARIASSSQSVPEEHVPPGRWDLLALRAGASENAREGRRQRHPKGKQPLQAQQEELRRIGLSSVQIDRLLTYRAAYRAGHYQPDPLLPNRLAFARWLYQQGKISG